MIKDFNKTAIVTATHDVSYNEMLRRIHHFSTLSPRKEGEKTVIFSENREGWIYALFGIWENHGIAVPVDASSTADDLAYIVSDCQPVAVWTSRTRLDTVREAMTLAQVDAEVRIIEEYERAEVGEEQATITYSSDDTALIIYTSGTTGSPKGVMLSYENLMTNIRSVADDVPIYNSERRTLILLPLHHVLPLMGSVIAPITRGGGVAICPSLNAADIMDTLCRGQVGIIIGVPRLWQTLYNGIKKKIDSNVVTRMLFSLCANVNNRKLSRFVFQSVRKKMGGHLDYCVSGGAALDKEIGEGLRTLGLDVLEGYGMTETAPMISFTRPGDIIPGCAGRPLPCVEVKLVDGELCAKGPNVMQGYYNRPEETAAVIDKDGFIHTGDLARMDEEGRVYITGRTKEIIVLSNGKNVQPSEIEFKLEKYDSKVKESAVVQDGDILCAIIVPQPEWARGKSDEEVEEALKTEVVDPYNRSTENYKKLMRVFVYRDELPRTKLDKLQRFRLPEILAQGDHRTKKKEALVEPTYEEYRIIRQYIEKEKKITVRPTDHIEMDLAFDSLDKVGLQSFIEQTFGTTVNADNMASYRNVAAIAEQVADSKTRMNVEEVDWNKLLNDTGEKLELPSSTIFFPLCAKMLKLYFRIYNRLSIRGKENIPAHGPFILAPNHQSYIDGAVVMSGIGWSHIKECYFYATEDHVKGWLTKWMARHSNVVVMERSNLKTSIQKLAEILRLGKNIMIFPEGSRTHTGELGTFKKTFAILSKELSIPIVPVCIKGAYDALPRGRHFITPNKITVEFLPPVDPQEAQSYDELSQQVKDVITGKLEA